MTVARTHQGQAPPGLFDESAGRGTAVAVVTDEAEYTYSALARMSAERAAEYPPVTTGRRMIGLVATNTIEFLVDYLAAHSAGHVVLLLPPDGAATDNLLAAWHPDVVAGDGRPLPAGVRTTRAP